MSRSFLILLLCSKYLFDCLRDTGVICRYFLFVENHSKILATGCAVNYSELHNNLLTVPRPQRNPGTLNTLTTTLHTV